MRRAFLKSALFGVLMLGSSLAATWTAQAQSLAISPQRIIIENAGAAAVSLSNTGKKAGSFRIELVDMIYKDDGSLVEAEQAPPGYPSAKPLVKFSPNQVRLGPGEQQNVRILVKRQAAGQTGEYRVHARLVQLPDVSDVQPKNVQANAVAGVVGIEQAIAIPVIVRFGATQATGSIAGMKLQGKGKTPALDLQLAREGNRSLYIDLRLQAGGKLAKEIKGIAVPVPNQRRRFVFALDGVDPGALGGATLEMVDHDTGSVIDSKTVK
jgi:fimbrial chaperone protein